MSLLGAFTGSDARRYAQDAYERNSREMQSGYQNNLGYQKQGYQTATGRLQPYEAAGRQGQQAYTNMLGLNGAGAQNDARTAYEGWNPYLGNDLSMADKAIARRSAAMGQSDSGMNALARNRAGMEIGSRDFYNYNDRLQGLGNQGFAAGNALAGLDTNNAQQQIAIENALRSGNVQNSTQFGNAQAQAGQGFINNLMGLGSLGISAFMPGRTGSGGGGSAIQNFLSLFGRGANGQVPIGQSDY